MNNGTDPGIGRFFLRPIFKRWMLFWDSPIKLNNSLIEPKNSPIGSHNSPIEREYSPIEGIPRCTNALTFWGIGTFFVQLLN